MVMRSTFDDYLIKQAVSAGSRLQTGCRVINVMQNGDHVVAYTKTGKFRARVLVGADGVNSKVADTVGLLPKRRTGVAIEAEIAIPKSVIQRCGKDVTFDFGALRNGYGWIFPKQEHFSVGVFQANTRKAPEIKQSLDHFIKQQEHLEDHKILQSQGHRIPLGGERAILHKDRVLLIGDAANLADAWMGEGIYYAVRSAMISANVIHKALTQGGNVQLDHHTSQVNSTLIPHLQNARDLARIVYSFPYLCSRLLQRSHRIQEIAFGAVRGTHTFQQLKQALIRRAPLLLIELLIPKQITPR
jgi:flavin-dependent dehydrogenase